MTLVVPKQTVLAIVAVLIVQAVILAGLAYAGEWRVWRFIANFTAQIDAASVLIWCAGKFQQVSPGAGKC